MNSKPVDFAVTTVNSAWAWRCLRHGCGITRHCLSHEQVMPSMRDHVSRYHATFHFGEPRTT